MIVQIPYGIVADKYGRRLVLFLALFGIAISMGENLLVCMLSVHVPAVN